jgi:cytidylate kinase
MLPPVIITIDGPAGTGKSTLAHLLAKRLGLEFLDTGAMYRAAALIAIESDIDPADGARLAQAIEHADLHFDWARDPPLLILRQRDISARIRDMDVSGIVSIVAAQSPVRGVLVQAQRRIAEKHPRLVSEGRDQGSVVFPDAPLRFFLTADVSVRTERRMAQLAAAGKPVDRLRIRRDIEERDHLDRTRLDGPLIRPEGALDINTGDGDAQHVVTQMESIARRQLPDAGFREPSMSAAPHRPFQATTAGPVIKGSAR